MESASKKGHRVQNFKNMIGCGTGQAMIALSRRDYQKTDLEEGTCEK